MWKRVRNYGKYYAQYYANRFYCQDGMGMFRKTLLINDSREIKKV